MDLFFRDEIVAGDPETIRRIVISTGFFRDDEVEVAVELAKEALAKGQQESGYHFLFALSQGKVAGYACYGPTPCTIGVYDLYWIVVDKYFRGRGIGKQIMAKVEMEIRSKHARKLYIETSSTAKYNPTRQFYLQTGYAEEARLKDFYNVDDDKVIFSKNL